MSWSITLIGTPDRIGAALDAESLKQQGQSKVEFDAALPGLKCLLASNFDKREGARQRVLKLKANGSGFAQTNTTPEGSKTEEVYRCCAVSLEDIGEILS